MFKVACRHLLNLCEQTIMFSVTELWNFLLDRDFMQVRCAFFLNKRVWCRSWMKIFNRCELRKMTGYKYFWKAMKLHSALIQYMLHSDVLETEIEKDQSIVLTLQFKPCFILSSQLASQSMLWFTGQRDFY